VSNPTTTVEAEERDHKFEVYEWGVITGTSSSTTMNLETSIEKYIGMEVDKPVIYFYSSEKIEDLSLSVNINSGSPEILIPEADTIGEKLTWNDITVYPEEDSLPENIFNVYKGDFAYGEMLNNYGVLLQNEGSYVTVPQNDRVDTSNFLFYEGTMNFDNKIVVENLDSVSMIVTIKNVSDQPVSNIYYTYIDTVTNDSASQNLFYLLEQKELEANTTITDTLKFMGSTSQKRAGNISSSSTELSPYFQSVTEKIEYTPSLIDMMMAEGFKTQESEVFEGYWKAEFFSELPFNQGTYVDRSILSVPSSCLVYMLSQENVEEILPMTISHKPSKLKRSIFIRILN